ncbi:MAG: D-alanine--D-alanine ligase [Clostridia bacterium]|nr:D-alanine--D-alanine ligase [Clostridia bacterium]
MNIVVLAGGLSPERDVSLTSGSLIANALIRRGHNVALVDVYCGLDNIPADIKSLFRNDKVYSYHVEKAEPDLDAVKASCGGREALIGPGVIELCTAADVVFVGLHGAMGENGQLQATLDNLGIRHYTGTGYIGALLSMDKDISKRLMTEAGVPNAEWVYFDTEKDDPSVICEKIGFPCVIKPSSCGSSVGVSRVFTNEELKTALSAAKKYERFIIAEKMISGRELTCAVLDGVALPPVEIIPKSGWYDYANKYQSGATTEICPAPLTEEQTRRIGEVALNAFHALRMEMYGRADFILGDDGEFYCLEVNALPGMTPTSLLPQEAAAVGIGYDELCDKLVHLAFEK